MTLTCVPHCTAHYTHMTSYSQALLNVATIYEIQGELDKAAALFQQAYSSLKDDAQAGAYLRVKSALIVRVVCVECMRSPCVCAA